jgi:bifunctional enzyme CysN/CysC
MRDDEFSRNRTVTPAGAYQTESKFDASSVNLEDRAKARGHVGGIIWFTGLSGSGKTTLSRRLERRLFDAGVDVFVLDGDDLRRGLNVNLGFSPTDRHENVRRIGEVAGLFAAAGLVVIVACISPFRVDREAIRAKLGDSFHEIYLSASVEVCEARDTKGLYSRARRGEIADFTGVSAPYEPPVAAQMTLDTGQKDVDWCVTELLRYVNGAISTVEQPGLRHVRFGRT